MIRRFAEAAPGIAAWFTLLVLVLFSWKLPVWVVFFIVLYDLFWFLKIVYLSFYLRYSFNKMRKYMKIDWSAKLAEEKGEESKKIKHLIILPALHEPYETVFRCLDNLSRMRYRLKDMFVILALEERGGSKDMEVGKKIEEKFGNTFGKFLITMHPDKIPGELAGKGANDTWAAKQAVGKIIDTGAIPRENVIVSTFDIDTIPGHEYFSLLTYKFLTVQKPERSSYQPIPVYTNNFYNVPVFARLVGFSGMFWQIMQQGRPEQNVTFSSHSMPLQALIEVGYWNRGIVSEDSRIFFQCLSHYGGDWKVEPLFYPVYMDAVEGTGFWNALRNLYRQQRRWAWGVENLGYIAEEFTKKTDKKPVPLRQKLFWLWHNFEGKYSWATSSFVIFFFGWLPNILGGDAFQMTIFSYNLPEFTGNIIRVATIGIASSAFLSMFFIPGRSGGVSKKQRLLYLLQWALTPLTLMAFSGAPALDALTRTVLGGKYRLGFWKTPKSVNAVE